MRKSHFFITFILFSFIIGILVAFSANRISNIKIYSRQLPEQADANNKVERDEELEKDKKNNSKQEANDKNNINSVKAEDNKKEDNNDKSKEKEKDKCAKEVFLTFDDGPSITNTRKIISILKENNIRATFFVVGKKIDEYPDIAKELYKSGMCIAPHTYSHDYKTMYKNVDSYFEDLEKCNTAIKKITGKNPPPYTRLPGGSDNGVSTRERMIKIRKRLNEKGIRYVDWNVSSADAVSHIVPTIKIKNNVMQQCKNKRIAVVLMHDAYYKKTTVEALPDIISYLKGEGFKFRTFNDISAEEEAALIQSRIINRGNGN